MEKDRAYLKGQFNKGDRPKESDFADLIDSAYNKVDDDLASGAGLDDRAVIKLVTSKSVIELLRNELGLGNHTKATIIDASGVGPTSIKITWTHTETVETKYKVFRSDTEDGKYVLVGEVLIGTKEYTDTTAVTGEVYFYRVETYDDNDGVFAVSEKVSGTTGLVASSIIIAQDDFATSPLNGGSRAEVIVDANMVNLSLDTANNRLQITSDGSVTGRNKHYVDYNYPNAAGPYTVSKVSFIRNVSDSPLVLFHSLYLNEDERIQIQGGGADTNVYKMVIKSKDSSGVVQTTVEESAITISDNPHNRIVLNHSAKTVDFEYWDGSQWTNMFNPTVVLHADILTAIPKLEGASGVSAVTVYMDDFYYTNDLYTTLNPA